jgi:cellulose synthase/poly-beta-1,6-N-acetylglucosamine synthase-like glycosyltransferase
MNRLSVKNSGRRTGSVDAGQAHSGIQAPRAEEPGSSHVTRPLVSVIVVGRNEGERLSLCLRSVRAMDFPQDHIELIYVDSHSSDDSLNRACEQGAHVVALPPGPTTAARARNAGYRLAKGVFLLFLDGDTVITPQFLSHALAFLKVHPEVAVYWGYRREVNPRRSLYNRVFDLEWVLPCGNSAFCGGDAVMRKCVLDEVGPFRDDLIAGEDSELCARIRSAGYTIWLADELMTYHDLAITSFTAYWRRCYRGGYAYAEVAERTQGALFKRESVKNHIQVAVYVLTPILLTLGFGWLGLCAAIGTAALALLRTAWRNRWRKASLPTTMLYAVHAHLCQVPVWLGQLEYLRNRHLRITREIIEYK